LKKTVSIIGLCVALAAPTVSFAQGTVRGADRGAAEGDRAAGPVGAVVGGAVGAATGTVGLGPGREGCSSTTVHREDGAGDSTTTRRTDC
jgi:hypothetical protein